MRSCMKIWMKVCNIDTFHCICVWCINQGVQSQNFAALYFEKCKLLFDGQECSIPWPQWRFGTLLEWDKIVQILVVHYAAKICNVSKEYWIDNIFVFMILSLNRSLPLVPYESILNAQSKSYIACNQIWFVCKAIPLRIYQISHINFLPFSWNLSHCVLCYCHNVNFFSSNGSLILMLCLLSDHLDQRWYDWLQKLNGFSFDIYYFLWHPLHISYRHFYLRCQAI